MMLIRGCRRPYGRSIVSVAASQQIRSVTDGPINYADVYARTKKKFECKLTFFSFYNNRFVGSGIACDNYTHGNIVHINNNNNNNNKMNITLQCVFNCALNTNICPPSATLTHPPTLVMMGGEHTFC